MMKAFIFISCDGHSKWTDREKENLRVLGFGKGLTAEEAFRDFLSENEYITRKFFDEVYCYPLDVDCKDNEEWLLTERNYFSIQTWDCIENPYKRKSGGET